ncbi:hypothetical protein BDE02_05G167000 [Populus trichocarpa]|nr:hypothetical protein BDE02_05G167000 [Populus trichocarpa]
MWCPTCNDGGQKVIALYLRSKLKDVDAQNKHSWETFPEEQDGRPGFIFLYGSPSSIYLRGKWLCENVEWSPSKGHRIVGWCPVPSDFGARFS